MALAACQPVQEIRADELPVPLLPARRVGLAGGFCCPKRGFCGGVHLHRRGGYTCNKLNIRRNCMGRLDKDWRIGTLRLLHGNQDCSLAPGEPWRSLGAKDPATGCLAGCGRGGVLTLVGVQVLRGQRDMLRNITRSAFSRRSAVAGGIAIVLAVSLLGCSQGTAPTRDEPARRAIRGQKVAPVLRVREHPVEISPNPGLLTP